MDILNLQHFCGIAKKKDQQKEVKVFGDSEVFVFDILEKSGMLFFKDRKNGTICRALGFMHLYRKMDWGQVENIMVDCGMSGHEAKAEICREQSLVGLYSEIDRLRKDYSSAQSKAEHSTVFGDWLRVSRNDFISIFGHIYDTPIQKCADYNMCIMRDESGIPNLIHIYSSNNRFLGAINLGVTQSNTSIQYSRSIDMNSWNSPRQILCQEIDIASFVTGMLPDDSSTPVGLIVNAGGVPNYGSVHPPTTFWVAKYDESPHKIINFYNGSNSLLTYRLPNKSGEAFVPTCSLSNSILHKSSVDFCKDVAAFASRNKINGIMEFVRIFLASSSINREAKTVLTKEYAKRMGFDHESAMSLIRKYGIGSHTITHNKKTYFIKDSRYHSVINGPKGGQAIAISNFIVIPERVYTVEGKNHAVSGTLICEGKSAPFIIDRNEFLSGSQFMEKLTHIADDNKMCIPFIYSHLDINHIRRMILDEIIECNTLDVKQLGFKDASTYLSSSWISSPSEIQFFDSPLDVAGQRDTFMGVKYNRGGKIYQREAMSYLNNICKDEQMKTMIFFVLRVLNAKLNNGTGTLFLNEESFNCCADILGCKISKDVTKTEQLQMSLNDCQPIFAKKNGVAAIVLHRNITSRTRDTIKFLNTVSRPKTMGVPLLPMLTKLALLHTPARAMQEICNSDYFEEVSRAEQLSHIFNNGEAKEFFDNVKEFGLDKKFVQHDDSCTTIEIIKCIKELKNNGLSINKTAIIKNLNNIGVRFQYPVRRYHDRSVCLVINGSTENLF